MNDLECNNENIKEFNRDNVLVMVTTNNRQKYIALCKVIIDKGCKLFKINLQAITMNIY